MIKKIFHLFTYIFITLVLILYSVFRFYPNLLQPISELLKIDYSHIQISIILACSLFIIDKLNFITLQAKTNNSQLVECSTEVDAYNRLDLLFKDQGVTSIQAVQLSGQTIQPLVANAKEKFPDTKIELALLADEPAKLFDPDKGEDSTSYHITRRRATSTYLNGCHQTNTTIKYYKSYPSACIVIINKNTAFLGWYRNYYNKKGILVLSSHDVPGVIAKKGTPLFTFAMEQFDKVWSTASDGS